MSGRRTQLAVIAALAALIVVVAIVISQSGSDEDTAGTRSGDVEQIFEGVPQSGLILGDPDAPAKVIEFVDMQCPFCAEFSQRAVPSLVEERVRTGELALELRVIAILGPDSETAALAAAATVPQDRLWQFSEAFFANQGSENSGYVTEGFIEAIYGMTPGLDVERAQSDRDSAAARDLIEENLDLANELGVGGTPALFLAEPGADPIELELSELTYAGFEDVLSAAGGP